MKSLEKFAGVSPKDITDSIPVLKTTFDTALTSYRTSTHPKIRMLDNFMLFCLASFILQVLYGVIMGKDPFNSMLAGAFCSLGQFALCASLRVNLVGNEDFADYSNKKAVFEFILASLLLYLACLCLIG